jgi:soluble lytic murein transglycosylase
MQLHSILTSIALTVCLSWAALSPAQAKPARAAKLSADELLVEMSQAFKKGDGKRLSSLLPQARGHLMEPWAAYWELRNRLDTAAPAEVQQFFVRYPGTYQEDRLRNDWLLLLGRRRYWSDFAAEAALYRMQDDREVRCYSLALEPQRSSPGVAAEFKRQWYAQKEADDACAYAAVQLFETRHLSDADIWHKVRLAIEASRPKLARLTAAIVSPASAPLIDEISKQPSRFLARQTAENHETRREERLLALIRLAGIDADQAASWLEKHAGAQLNPEQRSWAWGVVGKQAAQQRLEASSDYFANANNSELDDNHLGWKVRAALRQGHWKTALESIQAMSAPTRQEASWVYWQARAQLQLGKSQADRDAANKLFESIAGVRGFYEQLALEELGQRISVPPPPAPLTAQEKDAAQQNAGLRRALYAIGLGLRSEGVREWNYHTNMHQRGGMGERELLAAADLACQREVWDRCINTSERTRASIDFEQRFPLPHREAVLQRAAQSGLDPAFVYGLIRQESRFIMDAHSSVGAAGLMQLMPATARWTAKKIGLTGFKPQQINQRDTNLTIGAAYLKLVLDSFDGSMPLATAAYNAGPGRSRNWRGQAGAPALEAAIWAENIPLSETRDYVKRVLANTTSYAALISGQPQSLKSRLGWVGAKDARSPEINPDLP